MSKSIYSRDHICPDLKPGNKCFVVQQYSGETTGVVFHEHVPSHRISQDSEHAVLHDLALHFGGYAAVSFLHSRLNNRRGDPLRFPMFPHHVSYPEEGVLRHSLTCTSASVWLDSVISATAFRKQSTKK
jgi:hypothetical protein